MEVLEGDLLSPLPADLKGRINAVVCNPPYIPSAEFETLPNEVAGHEPRLALDGGPDGLDVFRRLAVDALAWLAPGGVFCVELDECRVRGAAEEALEWYEGVRVVSDLTGRDRVLLARQSRRP